MKQDNGGEGGEEEKKVHSYSLKMAALGCYKNNIVYSIFL